MWVYLTGAMLSIVAHRDQPRHLLVRARFRGDIERVFPDSIVTETPEADYRFRAVVPRGTVAETLAAAAATVDYPNFKATLTEDTPTERERAHAYHAAHEAAWEAQHFAAEAEKTQRRRARRHPP